MTERAVVLQVSHDDPEQVLRGTLAARNLLAAVGDEVPVELVVQGNAVTGLVRGSGVGEKVPGLLTKMPSLRVLACANAMRAHGVSQDQLIEEVDVVDAGVAHCARRQWDGWAYLRV